MANDSFQITNETARPVRDGTLVAPSRPVATATSLLVSTADLRYRTHHLGEDTKDLHRRAAAHWLQTTTTDRLKESSQDLLQHLSDDRGLGWSSIARLLNVSIPALRKWRLGMNTPAPENHKRLASLAALLDYLDQRAMIHDPAAWLELPLSATSITLVDVFRKVGPEPLIDYASSWVTAEGVLDVFDPGWRSELDSSFEVFIAADGQPAIRLREQNPDAR